MAVSRFIGRAIPDTHLYGALFAGAALSFCIRHLGGIQSGPLADLLAVASNATCGWSWLLARALFQRPETQRPAWPLALVLAMVLTGAFLRFAGDPLALLPRMIGNAEDLVSSTILLLATIEPLISFYRDMPKAERRFRLIFSFCYAADMTIGIFAVNGAPSGSILAQSKYSIQMGCALASLLGMGLAILYRDRHPIPEPSRTRRRAPSSAENELGERLLRLMRDDAAFTLAELKVADLANRLGEAEYKVTQCITGALGFRNFNHLVNRFRLEEAKRRLSDPAYGHLPILTIALDCGFGSIGPFNRTFKAEIGMTPTEFRRISGNQAAKQIR